MKAVLQSLLLLLSFAFVYIWQQSPLSQYTIQALGFLVFLFILVSARKRKQDSNPINLFSNSSWVIFILNTIILLLVFSTGGFSSSLFFLLYFLGFGIAFVFEPVTVFVFVIGAILIFLPQALIDNVAENLLKLGSLGLISPLAFFFGKEYIKGEKQQEEIEKIKERTKDAADTISKDVEEVMQREKTNLKQKDIEKLNDILEETEDLREEAKGN
ncbi:hypothetical protein C4559_05135 [Candidatus Microgenomates bacterium]|nr:MAG: hypothetical protein C4559_05135 [Candidatus Microgenomates bacterium]